jgi:hypothetical protein
VDWRGRKAILEKIVRIRMKAIHIGTVNRLLRLEQKIDMTWSQIVIYTILNLLSIQTANIAYALCAERISQSLIHEETIVKMLSTYQEAPVPDLDGNCYQDFVDQVHLSIAYSC